MVAGFLCVADGSVTCKLPAITLFRSRQFLMAYCAAIMVLGEILQTLPAMG